MKISFISSIYFLICGFTALPVTKGQTPYSPFIDGGACQGDCGRGDCQPGYLCWLRTNSNDNAEPDECSGTPTSDSTDYCVATANYEPNFHGDDGCGVDKCGLCEGDCDYDSDCQGDLVCFQRNSLEAAPSPDCDGVKMWSIADYCVRPLLTDTGGNLDSTSAIKGGACEGNCVDSDGCQPGYGCWLRSPGDNALPDECRGEAHDANMNYCVSTDAYPTWLGIEGCTPDDKCGECEGDCDSDDDCEEGLICHRRTSFDPAPPGCDQKMFGMADYCIVDPNVQSGAVDPSTGGDPHFTTWTGKKYDFHGVCDLILLRNPGFQNGLGLDIHIRTKQLKQYSYINSAVLQIGNESFEVMGDMKQNLFWINKERGMNVDSDNVGFINGHSIRHEQLNSKQHEFVVDLGGPSIVMKTFKKFVHVSIKDSTELTFGSSQGLFGAFGTGALVSRDKNVTFEDMNLFGQEWQVLPSEGMLFHNAEGPQAPEKCMIPKASSVRRRLSESSLSEKEAEIVCGSVDADVFEMCVFDVMATGDKDFVGAY